MNHKEQSFNHWQRGIEIIKSTWRIFQQEPKLLTIEVLSFAIAGALLGLFGALAWHWELIWPNFSFYRPQFLALVLLLYICVSTSYSILMGWFVVVVYQRLKSEPISLTGGWRTVAPRWKLLAGYGLLNGLVYFTFELLRDKIPFFGKIAAFLGQLAWTVANTFAIPIIAMSEEPVKPIAAVKKSAGLVRKTWGESVVSQFGIGLVGSAIIGIYTMLTMGVVMAVVKSPDSSHWPIIGLAASGYLIILIFLSLIASIAQAALYYYATTGKAPEAFNKELLRQAMTPKKARKIFSL